MRKRKLFWAFLMFLVTAAAAPFVLFAWVALYLSMHMVGWIIRKAEPGWKGEGL